MGERKGTIITVLISLFLLGSMSGIVFASSGNWVEVTRFTGEGGIITTESFTCDHVEWRIRWEIEPRSKYLESRFFPPFGVYIYPHKEGFLSSAWFESIIWRGTEETNGTLYIHDKNGTFYMEILAQDVNLESYTIIVEQ
ncbi:MAG: hypothetical protein E3J73_06265, partial [Candidatus Bathyarchaeum sp.]